MPASIGEHLRSRKRAECPEGRLGQRATRRRSAGIFVCCGLCSRFSASLAIVGLAAAGERLQRQHSSNPASYRFVFSPTERARARRISVESANEGRQTMNARRNFFKKVFGLGAGVAAASGLASAQHVHAESNHPGGVPVPVQTPDGKDLPFTLDNGVKVFNLVAERVKQQIAPTKTLDVWGYNGSAPGPTI
jgi:hypothetical protein